MALLFFHRRPTRPSENAYAKKGPDTLHISPLHISPHLPSLSLSLSLLSAVLVLLFFSRAGTSPGGGGLFLRAPIPTPKVRRLPPGTESIRGTRAARVSPFPHPPSPITQGGVEGGDGGRGKEHTSSRGQGRLYRGPVGVVQQPGIGSRMEKENGCGGVGGDGERGRDRGKRRGGGGGGGGAAERASERERKQARLLASPHARTRLTSPHPCSSVQAHGRAHGGLDVQAPHVLPVLFE